MSSALKRKKGDSHKAKTAREWQQRLRLFVAGEKNLPWVPNGIELLIVYSLVPLMQIEAWLACVGTMMISL